jgi:transposase
MTDDTIGVDISKATLDVHRLSDNASAQFENNNAGFAALRRWLNEHNVARIVYEPTGPYHRAFEVAMASRFPLVKVNPLQARRFAQAQGVRAKTDKVDARMLAVMGRTFSLEAQVATSYTQRNLKELHVARQALVKDRTRALNRQKTLTLPILKRQAKARITQLNTHLSQVDEAINTLLQSTPEMSRALDIICSIPGLSKISAAALLIEMPELGTLKEKQVASLAGLAPMTRQSGRWTGKAFIQGGRKHLRDALYMPAVVAARHNPDMKQFYDRLINAGKPAKVAFTAIMRKLILLANLLIKTDRKWIKIALD